MSPAALDPSAGDASTDSLIEVIGEAATRAFCEAFGGVGIYVPERVGEHHPIAAAIGIEAAQRLAAAYHGMELQVPMMGRRRAKVLELYATGRWTNRRSRARWDSRSAVSIRCWPRTGLRRRRRNPTFSTASNPSP